MEKSQNLDLFTAQVMTYETFAAINGASRQSIGDAGLHRANKNENTQKRFVMAQAKQDHELMIRRGNLRIEYERLVETGKLRPPTSLESSMAIANGHEDNASTQAARRVLTRKGFDWRTGNRLEE